MVMGDRRLVLVVPIDAVIGASLAMVVVGASLDVESLDSAASDLAALAMVG